jgi:chromate transporter
MGNVPSLHNDLVTRGWASEQEFAESLAVGQISPGPNGLWVISLGYLIQGVRGALLALVAICLPPLLVLFMDRLYRRVEHHPAVEGFVRGLSLSVVGVFAVVLLTLLARTGLDGKAIAITVASVGLGMIRRIPVVAVVALGAAAGILLR